MERQFLAIGFADLTDYSKLVETVGLDESIDVLQAALRKAGDIVVKHGAKIRKYIGDTILFTHEDPRAAVIVAQEIASSIVRKDHRFNLRFTVAVATGEVMVGKIGHPSFMVEDVMGRAVIRAALMRKNAARSPDGYELCPKTKEYFLKV